MHLPAAIMKLAFGVLFCAILVVVVSAQNKYTTKYDNIDVDRILSNDRVLANYIKCLMEEGPCTPDGRELKSRFFQNCLLSLLELSQMFVSSTFRDPSGCIVEWLLKMQPETERNRGKSNEALDVEKEPRLGQIDEEI